MLGELRQGALAGVMVDAIAAAADVPVADVRRAMMYAGDIGAVAEAALLEGSAGLSKFQLEILSPIAPMLAQTAADPAEALSELGGEAAFEWKMDGARIQVHKAGTTVRIYTRNLNEVGDAIPEIVELVAALPAQDLILDGETLAFDAVGSAAPLPGHDAALRPQARRASGCAPSCRYAPFSSTACATAARALPTGRRASVFGRSPRRCLRRFAFRS